jgi:hypothetical protein
MLRRLARAGLELEARDRSQTARYRNVLGFNFSQDGILLGSTCKICRVWISGSNGYRHANTHHSQYVLPDVGQPQQQRGLHASAAAAADGGGGAAAAPSAEFSAGYTDTSSSNSSTTISSFLHKHKHAGLMFDVVLTSCMASCHRNAPAVTCMATCHCHAPADTLLFSCNMGCMQLQVASSAQKLLREEVQRHVASDPVTFKYCTASDPGSYKAGSTLAVGFCVKHSVL